MILVNDTRYIHFYPTFQLPPALSHWVIPEKTQTEDILFWKNPWNFEVFHFTPGNSMITPGNSTLFLINPWKFHLLFPQHPWKFRILKPLPPPPPCLFFCRIVYCIYKPFIKSFEFCLFCFKCWLNYLSEI